MPAEAARLPEGRAAYYGLDKTESFDDFKKKYMKAAIEISEADKTKIADVTNKIDFTLAKDIKEAEEYAKQFVDDKQFGALGVSYSGISDESANAVNEALEKIFSTYNINKLGGVYVAKGNTKLGQIIDDAVAAYNVPRNSLVINNKAMKNLDDIAKAKATELRIIEKYKANPASVRLAAEDAVKASLVSGRATVADTFEDVINHELGHAFERLIMKMGNIEQIKSNMSKYAEKISDYATTDLSEYIAESFASYRKGENLIDPELKKAFESLKNSSRM